MLLLTITLALGFFLLGIYCGHRKTFPFGVLFRLKKAIVARVVARRTEPRSPREFVLELADASSIQTRRSELIRWLWGGQLPKQLVPTSIESSRLDGKYRLFSRHATMELWSLAMDYGLDSKIMALTPHRLTQDTALIYHQGHEGDVAHGADVIEYFLAKGFPVIAIAMPLKGPNSRPEVFLRRHGTVRLADHDYFRLLDHDQNIHSVRFFMEPVLACVNRLCQMGTTRIAMLGSSGGGWTTTLYAALDERIDFSFPVAGSLPFPLCGTGELSDYEVHHPELFGIANHLELYVMGACRPGRVSTQILNEFDTVVWAGRRGLDYEGQVKRTLARLGGGSFSVMIDGSWVGHGISRRAMRHITEVLSVPQHANE